jgi:sialate O-acetylesterase
MSKSAFAPPAPRIIVCSGRPGKLASMVATLLVFGIGAIARGDVTLPAIFSDHMVLQLDFEAPVWGWAEPAEEITVSIASQTKTVKADSKGKWMVKLERMKAGGAHVLTVKGRNTITVHDVQVGEVWLCSGQSNMAMTVAGAKDFAKEKAAATYPKLRMFREASGAATTPQERPNGSWLVCTPDTVGGFSATAYFFGRQVHQSLNVPVGLVHSSVGGTAIEAWTSLEAQKDKPELIPIFGHWNKLEAEWDPAKALARYEEEQAAWNLAAAQAKAEGKAAPRPPRKPVDPRLNNNHPANLFNGKIAPLIPYSMRGAIWYQGESNASISGGSRYGLQLETLIKDWRSRWGQGDFPFAWVQLPNFRKLQSAPVEESGWALVREGMLKTLKLPNTGMAIAIDVGEANDVHPKNKQDVGKRLALWALANVYGQKNAYSGPLPASHKVKGNKIIVVFDHADGGLVVKGGPLKGFAIAGADGKWFQAQGEISGNQIVLSHPKVVEPVAVRYSWADNPDGNLYNVAGLPASPFRTDSAKPPSAK